MCLADVACVLCVVFCVFGIKARCVYAVVWCVSFLLWFV